jgi:hypothetical protein
MSVFVFEILCHIGQRNTSGPIRERSADNHHDPSVVSVQEKPVPARRPAGPAPPSAALGAFCSQRNFFCDLLTPCIR